jgi:hypothetical protein
MKLTLSWAKTQSSHIVGRQSVDLPLLHWHSLAAGTPTMRPLSDTAGFNPLRMPVAILAIAPAAEQQRRVAVIHVFRAVDPA